MVRREKGITLISLIVSVVIMLILLGVSLNVVMGDKGILTQAQEAVLTHEDAQRREELEFILLEYNIGDDEKFTNYLSNLKEDGEIEDFLYISGTEELLIIQYKSYYYELEEKGSNYVIKGAWTDDFDNIENKNYIVTPDNIATESIEIEEGKSYVILDEVNGSDFNFEIPAGEPVTIKLLGNMTIDNKEYERSAIDLEEGATLNLYVYETVEVNSGYGADGATASSLGAKGGPGGYAGIHVPEGATLNLYGTGTLIAYGGDAGDGGGAISGNTGGGGGGGAGAGIGGSGGSGGDANTVFLSGYILSEVIGCSGSDGGAGETCGTVNIIGDLEVYAYGGGGGAGGIDTSTNSGSGAGGYPAAGIGGGGAGGGGGDHACSGGGYTVGNGEAGLLSGYNGHGSSGGNSYIGGRWWILQ